MKVLRFDNITNAPLVLALGFFDCVHSGHRKLLAECNSMAKNSKAFSGVFTFDNNPSECFNPKKSRNLIYDFNERCKLFENIGVDFVVYDTFDQKFCKTEAEAFLKHLFNCNIAGLVCGYDYTFGKNASGDVEMLKKECQARDIPLKVVSPILYNGQKVSSTRIFNAIKNGDLSDANKMLVVPFTYSGMVIKGFGIGTKIGFPTANVKINQQLVLPADGVYGGFCSVNNKRYKSIINVGGRPTYGDYNTSIEAHLLDYKGDLYGQTICLSFERVLRPQKLFNNGVELSQQLCADVAEVGTW